MSHQTDFPLPAGHKATWPFSASLPVGLGSSWKRPEAEATLGPGPGEQPGAHSQNSLVLSHSKVRIKIF